MTGKIQSLGKKIKAIKRNKNFSNEKHNNKILIEWAQEENGGVRAKSQWTWDGLLEINQSIKWKKKMTEKKVKASRTSGTISKGLTFLSTESQKERREKK